MMPLATGRSDASRASCQWEFEFLAPQQDRQRHVEETVQGSKKGHPNHPEERPKNNAKIVWFSKKTKTLDFQIESS